MSNTISSTNMSMPVPVVAVDPGPQWATDVNSCLGILDAHNHAPGYGVQITPDGLDISSDLSFQTNNAISLKSARFSSQNAVLSGGSDLGCLYVVSADLYYNDENGNQIRITQSGGIAGSPGSISNLTSPASASYVSGSSTFVWQSAANTPANMDFGSAILRNIVANSKGLTLAPPAAMAADYTITLPSLPASAKFMSIDNTGTIAASWAVDNSTIEISSNTVQVKDSGITTSKIADGAVTLAKIASGVLPVMTEVTFVNNSTWTATFTGDISITAVGGGGGGGGGGKGSSPAGNHGGGGGGGGGSSGTARTTMIPVTNGDVLTIQIGAGGAGGAGATTAGGTGTTGASGTRTLIHTSSPSTLGYISAKGGNGGAGGVGGTTNVSGGTGGAGGTNVYEPTGSAGGAGSSGGAAVTGTQGFSGGAGGGGAGLENSANAADGGAESGATGGTGGTNAGSGAGGGGGAGGSSFVGVGGNGGNGGSTGAGSTGANGASGVGSGGGGGGGSAGVNAPGNGGTGGNGGSGYVIIAYMDPQ